MWYKFRQNNSGGRWAIDQEKGIGVENYIEAHSAHEANGRAKDLGIYFDGVEEGYDCECCGDRWYAVSETSWDRSETPPNPVSEYAFIWHDKVYFHPLEGKFYTIKAAEED